jgi:RNA polymerase sigma-70 factor (ECF subfamily)
MTDRYQHMTDNELLEHYYTDSNQEWIGILLQRYTLLLLGVCMKYLKNETEAKDCVQQIFLKVLTEVPKYRIDYFKSWLYMVAKNHCLMRLRDKDKSTKELTEKTNPAQVETDKQDLLQNEHTYELLEEAIEELNAEQKTCITHFYLQKLSYQQIAQKTGFSLMQVKSYIQNGKRNLKILLEKKLAQKRQNSR